MSDSCEIISLKLEGIANTFSKVKNVESSLIIIGGAPPKISSRYTSTRISDAVKFLTRITKISSEKVVFGIGQPSNQYAYLKFYVNGELVDEIKTSGKGRLCFGMG